MICSKVNCVTYQNYSINHFLESRKRCEKYAQQLPPAEATTDHPKAKELSRINEILDSNNSIYDLILQDLGISDNNVGANGMTAEQVISPHFSLIY